MLPACTHTRWIPAQGGPAGPTVLIAEQTSHRKWVLATIRCNLPPSACCAPLMAERETTQDDASTPPVVLCCAVSDETTARAAADALLARGHEVELIVGVETGHSELQAAIGRLNSQGLYVLCRSSAMPRSTIDELRAVLRSHEVPFGRTLTLAIEAKRPRALEERVVSVLRRMVTGRPDKGSKRPSSGPASSGPAAPRQSTPPPPSTKASTGPSPSVAPQPVSQSADSEAEDPVDADEIAAWADSLVGEVPAFGVDPSELGAAESNEALAGVPAGVETSKPAGSSKRSLAFSTPAPDYQPVLNTQVASIEEIEARDGNTVKQAVQPPSESVPPIAPLPPAVPPSTPSRGSLPPAAIPPAPSPSASGLAPALSSAPAPSPAFEDEDDDESLAVGGSLSRALGGPRGMMLVLGGAAALIVLAVVVATTSGPNEDPAKAAGNDKVVKAAAISAGADNVGGDKASPSKAGDDDAGAKPADDGAQAADLDDDGAAGDDPPGDPQTGGLADPANAPSGAADDEGGDDEGGADGGADDGPAPEGRKAPVAVHYKPPTPPADPPSDPVPSGTGDSPEVAKALRDREVRAIDLFVVAPEDSDAMSHTAAVAYCEGMTVAGLGAWRMPMLGELNSVATAGLTSKSTYWSDTLGDAFGDTRIILNAKKKRMGAATVGFDGARVLCIRDRR